MTLKYAGVSTAIQASMLDGLSKQDTGSLFRNLGDQLAPELRRHIGDVKPKGDPLVDVSGPHLDPVQGMIYVMSMAVLVETDDLPADCPAYEALTLTQP